MADYSGGRDAFTMEGFHWETGDVSPRWVRRGNEVCPPWQAWAGGAGRSRRGGRGVSGPPGQMGGGQW